MGSQFYFILEIETELDQRSFISPQSEPEGKFVKISDIRL